MRARAFAASNGTFRDEARATLASPGLIRIRHFVEVATFRAHQHIIGMSRILGENITREEVVVLATRVAAASLHPKKVLDIGVSATSDRTMRLVEIAQGPL